MFEGQDHQALQTLIDNNTVTPETQKTPVQALKAIQSVIKDVHFWHHCYQLFSDFCSCLRKVYIALSNRICAIIAKCQFSNQEIRDIMKIMVLQHAVKYHKARDWICLQDQSTLMYQSLLAHCRQLEASANSSSKHRHKAELT